MNKKFWNWIRNQDGESTLYLNGIIAEESWFDDDVTPELFKADLMNAKGDITVSINSPGGDCIAAARIYNMLKEYAGEVTVKIDGIAASAASVIAMAGYLVYMSPVSQIMIHNPMTFAIGDSDEMKKAINMLNEVKESIINAYEIKTKMPRSKLAKLMDAETWLNANKAIEYGFADDVLYKENTPDEAIIQDSFLFSRKAVINSLISKLPKDKTGTKIGDLDKRLNLLK